MNKEKDRNDMKLTSLLDILGTQPHLSTDTEILEAVKLIIDAEKMDSGEKDTVIAAFKNGPLWDGDVPSKTGRDNLVTKGYIAKVVVKKESGYNALTYKGLDIYRILNVLRS